MRKIATISMIAAATFAVAACSKTENTNIVEANATITEMNAGDAMEGTVNDSMTNVDGAMGASTNMAEENMMEPANTTNTM